MSQTYTDDCYSLGMQATTSLQAFEDNFAALKSAFSGVTAPGNTVAGMWWYDTTAHILRVRNEDNTAWLSVWDLANNKPVMANIVPADFAAAMKDAAAATASLRTLGTGATQACAGNDPRLSAVADGSITGAKLVAVAAGTTHTLVSGYRAHPIGGTSSTSYVVGFEFEIKRSGVVRLSYTGHGNMYRTARFKSGVNDTYGDERNPEATTKTYTDDLTVVSGDKIRIKYKATAAGLLVDFTNVSVMCIDPLMSNVLIGVPSD